MFTASCSLMQRGKTRLGCGRRRKVADRTRNSRIGPSSTARWKQGARLACCSNCVGHRGHTQRARGEQAGANVGRTPTRSPTCRPALVARGRKDFVVRFGARSAAEKARATKHDEHPSRREMRCATSGVTKKAGVFKGSKEAQQAWGFTQRSLQFYGSMRGSAYGLARLNGYSATMVALCK